LCPLGTAATNRPIVSDPVDYDDEEIGGMMFRRGNRSTRRKPVRVTLCPQNLLMSNIRILNRYRFCPCASSVKTEYWVLFGVLKIPRSDVHFFLACYGSVSL
jgi:hypothetical protein